MARWRQRQAGGRIVLQIEVDEYRLAAAMIANGALTEREAEDREYLARAVGLLVEAWIARDA